MTSMTNTATQIEQDADAITPTKRPKRRCNKPKRKPRCPCSHNCNKPNNNCNKLLCSSSCSRTRVSKEPCFAGTLR